MNWIREVYFNNDLNLFTTPRADNTREKENRVTHFYFQNLGSVTSYWIGFFKEAGIPAGDAANYAVTFTDNRILPDMLMDLNKEYLHDMGITVLGDVISILKHAKAVHTQLSRDKVLKGTSHMVSQSLRPARSSPVPKRSTAASRFVDHYLGTGNDPNAAPMNEPGVPMVTVETEPNPSPSIVRLKPRLQEEVPVPKTRRVFPEHEGRYKVTMPRGTTAKTKKILENRRRLSDPGGRKSSVFERLGGADTKVTVTGLGSGSLVKTTSEPSVFNRLGGKTVVKRAATSTSHDLDSDDSDQVCNPPLAYAGVLKSTGSPAKKKKTTKKVVSKKVSRRSEPIIKTQGILSMDARSEDTNVKSRLGKMISAADSSTGISPTVERTTVNKSYGISMRLGPKKSSQDSAADSTVTFKASSSDVFDRLGKHAS